MHFPPALAEVEETKFFSSLGAVSRAPSGEESM
jgi:hypothetical protein